MQNATEEIGLSFEDLRLEIARFRGRMPASTLYHWMNTIGMRPNLEGFYTEEDLEILKCLYRFLKRKPNIKLFKQVLEQEKRKHHAY